MVAKTLMGAVAIVAVPVAIAGGYFLPHPPPPPNPPEQYDLPPASIVEMPEEDMPKRVLPPHPVKDHMVARA